MASSDCSELFTESELIALCQTAEQPEVLGGEYYGNKVIKISDTLVVKFGIGVTREEADNQSKAYSIVDHRTVHIPRVYRFFTNGPYGAY